MKLRANQGDASLNALGRPALELVRAVRDRVAFTEGLQDGLAKLWRYHGEGGSRSTWTSLERIVTPIGGAESTVRCLLATSLGGWDSVFLALDASGSGGSDFVVDSGSQAFAATAINPLIERSPVLDGRRFVEFSFEMPNRGVAGLLLGIMGLVRELHLPIGHVHCPSSPMEGSRVRVGIGIDPARGDEEFILLQSMWELAHDSRLGLAAASRALAGWTDLEPDWEEGMPAQPKAQWQIQFISEARVGLVADVLSYCSQEGCPVDHMGMTVIEGCTVAALGGSGRVDERQIGLLRESLRTDLGTLQVEGFVGGGGAVPSGNVALARDGMWLGWRQPQRFDALARLIGVLGSVVGNECKVTYVISRLVEGGATNAGKLRVVPSRDDSLPHMRRLLDEALGDPSVEGLTIDLRAEEQELQHRTR